MMDCSIGFVCMPVICVSVEVCGAVVCTSRVSFGGE